jgi:hypothetical protein
MGVCNTKGCGVIISGALQISDVDFHDVSDSRGEKQDGEVKRGQDLQFVALPDFSIYALGTRPMDRSEAKSPVLSHCQNGVFRNDRIPKSGDLFGHYRRHDETEVRRVGQKHTIRHRFLTLSGQ